MQNPFEILPESVIINNVAYPIDADFRLGVEIELAAVEDVGPDEYVDLVQRFYRGRIPADVNAAAEKMIWFFGGGDEPSPIAVSGDKKPRERVYDYRQDAAAIAASFRTAYGIDLTRERLHWWAFRRLLWNLPDNTPFKERVGYRCADTKKMDKARRKAYQKLKELYAIRKVKKAMTAEEAEAAMLAKVDGAYRRAEAAKDQMERGD